MVSQLRSLLRVLMRVLFRVQVSGDASVFTNERTLIVANHESLIDGFLLALFLPVKATFVVHTVVTKNALFRVLLRFVPHLVVDSTSPLAIKLTVRLVETGTPVVIFPEGG
jgi:acyl-[acyl-carrier-protein]-phospholipid O-acyltransferase / long-chain-fatty-acid--[acyl-carrier-protein] ligase